MTTFSQRYGPWAVVTGAAQGVGLAFAEELLERDLAVVLVDRSSAVHDVAAGLGDAVGSDARTRSVQLDLSDAGWVEALDEATADLEIGLAVANAGISFVGPFTDMTAAERRALLAVNVDAVVELAAWALPAMVERGRGGFVVTSSGSALAGTGGVGLYSASKAFVLNLAEAVGWELRDTGVDTQAVIAPSMDTPAFRDHGPDASRMMAPAVDPRTVVARALDALGDGGWFLGDEGLEMVAGIERRQRVDIMSSATTAMYPDRFGG